jgi:flavin reductase (DIM6/NTAB) family NADH-FMN oxidoreductase RutF
VPTVVECPVSVECRLRERFTFHDAELFLGEVASVLVDEQFICDDVGHIDYHELSPIVFNQGEYWTLFERIGRYGCSREADTDGDEA